MSKTKLAEIYDKEKNEIQVVDASDKHLEKVARGYILGTQKFDNSRQLRENLEEKVTKKIGKKGKFLTDKLFELIEGVYIVDKRSGKDGMSVKYYQQPPSLQAIIYALDRVLGKPKTISEHSETKSGVVLVEHIIKGMVTNPKREYVKNEDGGNVLGVGTKSGTGGETGTGGDVIGNSDNVRVSETVVPG